LHWCHAENCGLIFKTLDDLTDHAQTKHITLACTRYATYCRAMGCNKGFSRSKDLRAHAHEWHLPNPSNIIGTSTSGPGMASPLTASTTVRSGLQTISVQTPGQRLGGPHYSNTSGQSSRSDMSTKSPRGYESPADTQSVRSRDNSRTRKLPSRTNEPALGLDGLPSPPQRVVTIDSSSDSDKARARPKPKPNPQNPQSQ
jgi:hypothetical protein